MISNYHKHSMTITARLLAGVLLAGLLFAIATNGQDETVNPKADKSPGDGKNLKTRAEQKEISAGLLQDNLQLLGQFKKPPEVMFRIYEIAYKALAEKRDATFMDVANSQEFQRICRENGITHLGGPMLGSLTADGAQVWVRTVRPAQVEVRVMVNGVEKTFGPVSATAQTDLSAVVPVTGLSPSTRYLYRVLVDGAAIAIPNDAAITTAPTAEKTGAVRIVFGSCFHRWGLGNDKQANTILSRHPAALLTIGDIAAQDRDNNLGMHRADYLLRDFRPAWQTMTASLPVFATWDDHDYFNNDKAGIPKGYTDQDRIGVRDVFMQSWANPSYGFNDKRGGTFLRTRLGPCDVIMVDERYFRTGKEGSFLGEDQMQWLETQLLDCKGPFIILSCGTMWSDYISDGKDSWGVADPQGRERLFRFIETHHIGGVLLISGDRHGARGFRIPRPSGFNFFEFEAASLGGRGGPPVLAKGNDRQYQLYGMSGEYAFGEFTINAMAADPTVEFRLIGDDGKIFHEMTLTRSQLTPPPQTTK